jgi:carbohydrate-selective porin OprB
MRCMKKTYKAHFPLKPLAALIASAALSGIAFCGTPASEDRLGEWWGGKYLTGDWLGARGVLADRGVEFKGKWVGVYYGVVDSQRGSRGFFDQELAFDADVDLAKLTGSGVLRGVSAFGGVRWRDPRSASNPNTFVEGNPMFNPGRYQSGTQWRLTQFGVGYVSPEMFGVKNFLTLKGGWLQPQKDFMVQPLSVLFVNNAICSSKGLTYNMPWSSSLSTWGGVMQVKPSASLYLKGSLYMAAPQLTASGNHGLAFEGYAQDPSRNGLMTMIEAGWTPNLGASKLPGKYAAGGYYFGVDAKSFDGKTASNGIYGFYFQADQMLYREPSAEGASAAESSSGKSFKSPVAPSGPLSDQGLSMFNLLSFAPDYINLVDFYFQSGLVYKGLIPGRDNDLAMCAMAYGNYSGDRIHVLQGNGVVDQPNFTMVLEAGYRVQINPWSYIQPYAQYVIHPSGTDAVANATVLGFMAGLTF